MQLCSYRCLLEQLQLAAVFLSHCFISSLQYSIAATTAVVIVESRRNIAAASYALEVGMRLLYG